VHLESGRLPGGDGDTCGEAEIETSTTSMARTSQIRAWGEEREVAPTGSASPDGGGVRRHNYPPFVFDLFVGGACSSKSGRAQPPVLSPQEEEVVVPDPVSGLSSGIPVEEAAVGLLAVDGRFPATKRTCYTLV
jgi:hypothetical protein